MCSLDHSIRIYTKSPSMPSFRSDHQIHDSLDFPKAIVVKGAVIIMPIAAYSNARHTV